ncbi:MAG: hypothetical protein R8G33_04540 [Gammaproteobacteria bacterium]|nr:hypothetical protein [Gammaproteobacteria bacterium]
MNLKPKNSFIDRRSEEDRRTSDKTLWSNNVERRKRPDRRLDGLDVDVVSISEDEFLEIFSQFLPKPSAI